MLNLLAGCVATNCAAVGRRPRRTIQLEQGTARAPPPPPSGYAAAALLSPLLFYSHCFGWVGTSEHFMWGRGTRSPLAQGPWASAPRWRPGGGPGSGLLLGPARPRAGRRRRPATAAGPRGAPGPAGGRPVLPERARTALPARCSAASFCGLGAPTLDWRGPGRRPLPAPRAEAPALRASGAAVTSAPAPLTPELTPRTHLPGEQESCAMTGALLRVSTLDAQLLVRSLREQGLLATRDRATALKEERSRARQTARTPPGGARGGPGRPAGRRAPAPRP